MPMMANFGTRRFSQLFLQKGAEVESDNLELLDKTKWALQPPKPKALTPANFCGFCQFKGDVTILFPPIFP